MSTSLIKRSEYKLLYELIPPFWYIITEQRETQKGGISSANKLMELSEHKFGLHLRNPNGVG